MKGIILAAGRGARMGSLTFDRPKCMLDFRGASLLDYQIKALNLASIHEIVVLVGHGAESVQSKGASKVLNPDWETTNMVATLACAGDDLKNPFLVHYGDVLCRPEYIEKLVKSSADIAVLVDSDWLNYWKSRFVNPFDDAETLEYDHSHNISDIGNKISNPEKVMAQYMGMLKFQGKDGQRAMSILGELRDGIKISKKPFKKMFMTDFLALLIEEGFQVQAIVIKQGWLEFDSAQDLELQTDWAISKELEKRMGPCWIKDRPTW